MSLAVVGINHRSAPVAIREQVAYAAADLPAALQDLCRHPAIKESLIVSTCNRTELYCSIDEGAADQVAKWVIKDRQLADEASSCLYTLEQYAVVQHVFSVASGLDSAVLGEPQILGQLKDAFQHAEKAGTIGPLLGRLFRRAFTVAKQVRTGTEIGSSPISVAYAAVSLARQIFSRLNERTALLIGAGETIELAARHLHSNDLGRMVIANRRVSRARELARRFDAYAISLGEIPAHLAEADIIISSTSSPVPLLSVEAVAGALAKRRHQPMFIVDIAIPRDVDPAVADLLNVYLYTVDDLGEVIQENLQNREQAAQQARQIIQAETAGFAMAMRELDAVPTIRRLRALAQADADRVLDDARRDLASGEDPATVLNHLARQLTNKFLHQPSSRLRQAGEEGDMELVQAAKKLFALDDKDDGDS
ncbi:MAG: glutamyl-tRNA reductase [Gammaproteobacteria bacterium]|nr:MAG: glutamyl-tRNA reductase [Gammaproteobacteria bacterium]